MAMVAICASLSLTLAFAFGFTRALAACATASAGPGLPAPDLSVHVDANTFRNPALVAKMITTIDHISDGRAILGVGAGWAEHEHEGFGFEFGSCTRLVDDGEVDGVGARRERPGLRGRRARGHASSRFPPD